MTTKPTLAGIAITPKIMAPMETLEAASITVEAGIDGDARGKKRDRQITILFADDWRDALAEVEAGVGGAGAAAMEWTRRRANLLIHGMRSPQTTGGSFIIGDVALEVVEETTPCEVMDGARRGLRDALAPDWRGGVCCRVLAGGTIALGDAVHYRSRDERIQDHATAARNNQAAKNK